MTHCLEMLGEAAVLLVPSRYLPRWPTIASLLCTVPLQRRTLPSSCDPNIGQADLPEVWA